ncbi:FKBP12-interacting protein of 37 kDa-like [Cajanus cajan]|uniref:FKBP12-interacting protein of 37 kDa-like n=1 Tax=Cajanus cajan TaxID=3821 RepID=UPI0010FAD7F7|nr:FKBP12-interacting protein of 37 kDa-like [Cajanus cajan]
MSAGTTPAPKLVINYLQDLKSPEESLREQLEKAKKKEAAFIVTFAKREQEIAELKDPCRPGVKDAVRVCIEAGIKCRDIESSVAVFECVPKRTLECFNSLMTFVSL